MFSGGRLGGGPVKGTPLSMHHSKLSNSEQPVSFSAASETVINKRAIQIIPRNDLLVLKTLRQTDNPIAYVFIHHSSVSCLHITVVLDRQ